VVHVLMQAAEAGEDFVNIPWMQLHFPKPLSRDFTGLSATYTSIIASIHQCNPHPVCVTTAPIAK